MTTDVVAAARLVSFAAAPKVLPARDAAYADLVARYLSDPAFVEVVQDVATGLGLELAVDPVAGVVAYSDSDGFFRRRLADMARTPAGRNANESRTLFALTLLAVARTAFPHPADLLNPVYVARVESGAVLAYLDRLVEEVSTGADDAEADKEEAEEVWRAWTHLRVARAGFSRYSLKEKVGLIRRVCDFLVDEGHLRPGDDRNAAWWRTTPRFRFAVHTLVTDSQVVPALRQLIGSDLLLADPAELP